MTAGVVAVLRVEAREDADLGARFRRFGQQRLFGKLIFEIFVDNFRLGNDDAVGIEAGNFSERIDFLIFGGMETAGRIHEIDLQALVIDRDARLGCEVGKIGLIKFHRNSSL